MNYTKIIIQKLTEYIAEWRTMHPKTKHKNTSSKAFTKSNRSRPKITKRRSNPTGSSAMISPTYPCNLFKPIKRICLLLKPKKITSKSIILISRTIYFKKISLSTPISPLPCKPPPTSKSPLICAKYSSSGSSKCPTDFAASRRPSTLPSNLSIFY